jgi:hypothetical protein
MTLLNWLPELSILGALFFTLVMVNFRTLTIRALAPLVSIGLFSVLVYFSLRPDLAYFETPLSVLHSDSFSYFGRLLGVCSVSVFALGFYFHGALSVRSKQLATLFLLFIAAFVSLLMQANHWVLFAGAAIGIYFCAAHLILIESGKDAHWIRIIRQKSMVFGVWLILLAILFVLSMSMSGTQQVSEWLSRLEPAGGTPTGLWLSAILILFCAVIPLEALPHSGRAPLGVGVLYFGLHLVIQTFWIRIGVPFFNKAEILEKQHSQLLIALLLGAFTLRYAYQAVRAREHHRWFSASIPVLLGLGFFLTLLPSDRVLPAFFCFSLSLLFTVALISKAFLDETYRQKGVVIGSLVTLMGVPPLILGDQIYQLIHDVVLGGNWAAGIIMIVSWFALAIAVIQMMGKVLIIRNAAKERRAPEVGELFFVALYLLCVITLTIVRPALSPLLNEHPLLNLW